jgi:membrane protein YqaA with SNARE-associated domain
LSNLDNLGEIPQQTQSSNQGSKNIVRRLYDWVLHWATTPYGMVALFGISFIESSFFPIPPDVLLIALAVATPFKWKRIALICTVGSVLGGCFGYLIGYLAWDSIGVPVLEAVAHVNFVEHAGRTDLLLPTYLTENFGEALGGKYLFEAYDKWNSWIVFIFGLTPLPYKIVTITAGVAKVNVPVFIFASIFARALRFFVVAWIISKWGENAKIFIDKYFNILATVFVILLIAGFAVLKLLF